MKAEDLAKSNTETGHQRALFCWTHYPEVKEAYPLLDTQLLFAIPNGGARGDNVKSRSIRGNALVAEGVKSGVADIFLSVARGGYLGFYIEMKVKNNKPTKKQLEFRDRVTEQGYLWAWYNNWEHARDDLVRYIELPKTIVIK